MALPLAFWRNNARSTGDLFAGMRKNRVSNGVPMALRATEMDEDAGAGKHETGGAGDLVAGVLNQPESVLQSSDSVQPLSPVLVRTTFLFSARYRY